MKCRIAIVLLLTVLFTVSCDDAFFGVFKDKGVSIQESETPDVDVDDLDDEDIEFPDKVDEDLDVPDQDVVDDDVPVVPDQDVDEVVTLPQTLITGHPDPVTNNSVAVFTFESDTADVFFYCSLDGSQFSPCSSPVAYADLQEGNHTFSVKSALKTGEEDSTPATFQWRIDKTSPVVSIESGPEKITNQQTAVFTISSSEPETVFECLLDGGDWAECGSEKTYGNVTEGEHLFSARGKDVAGNLSKNPALYSWVVDVTPPQTNIVLSPSEITGFTEAVFEFLCNEVLCSFECSMDDSVFEECISPKSYVGLSQGEHTFRVKAEDAAGNVEDPAKSYTFTVDLTAPDTRIVEKPNYYSNTTVAVFRFEYSVDGSSFECKLDDGEWEACTTPKAYIDLNQGAHSFAVRAITVGGVKDPTPAAWQWIIDTTLPETVITDGPDFQTDMTTAIFSFEAKESNDAVLDSATFECRIDDDEWESCTSPKQFDDLEEGDHSFEVRATTVFGNTDLTPARYEWRIGEESDADAVTDEDVDEAVDEDTDELPDDDVVVSCSENSDCKDLFGCTIDVCDSSLCRYIQDHSVCTPGKICYEKSGCQTAEGRLCKQCDTSSDCHTGDVCSTVGDDNLCLIDCEYGGLCPTGFSCLDMIDENFQPSGKACFPDNGVCCLDIDGDNAGIGYQCTAFDCDETNPEINEAATEVCDYRDNNCDNLIDEGWDTLGATCFEGQGQCLSSGKLVCDPDNQLGSPMCTAVAGDPSPEICDDIDNNCDGNIDNHPEGLWNDKSQLCEVGVGLCMRKGILICDQIDPLGSTVCSAVAGNPVPEICDGKDNDCNNAVDDNIERRCELTLGVCDTAMSICQGNLGWSKCGITEYGLSADKYGVSYEKQESSCDGFDNDCNGTVDDVIDEFRLLCLKQRGVCQGKLQRCVEGEWQACVSEDYGDDYEEGIETRCDSLDNNCDGSVDNIPDDLKQVCEKQQGVCAGAFSKCLEGSWKDCGYNEYFDTNPEYQVAETKCDGLDNDCNGTEDDILKSASEKCENQTGICLGSVKSCVAGVWMACTDAEYSGHDGRFEVGNELSCDGVDNNCDGNIDNISDENRQLCEKNEGVCAGSKKFCIDGSWKACSDNDYLNHSAAYEPGAEEVKCDGVDNNCDGTTDNIASANSLPCEKQTGACQNALRRCVAGSWAQCSEADYESNNSDYEEGEETLCDGIDNNCDGLVDNIPDAFRQQCDKQDGVCSGALKKCVDGAWQPCSASDYVNHNAAYESGAEEVKCDNLDNNCDGSVDNLALAERLPCDKQGGVCSGAKRKCVGGEWQNCGDPEYAENSADYESGDEVTCDNLDNNCDGVTDNIVFDSRENCAKSSGVCSGSKKVCENGVWQECSETDYLNHNAAYESGAEEVKCDNLDNNCDGTTDNIASANRLPCERQTGACANSTRSCVAGKWEDCGTADYESNNSAFEDGDETLCDGIDNNCDGLTDNIPQAFREPCDSQDGVCNGSQKRCVAGSWQACSGSDYANHNAAYESGAEEVKCDNLDNNCDGTIDNLALENRLPCDKQGGVCSGSKRACVAGSWQNCTDVEYAANSSDYESGEETKCDNLDNNCDGLTDNIVFASRQNCEKTAGVCSGSKKVCENGVWQSCTDSDYAAHNASYESGAEEVKCDNLDNNCDGTTDNLAEANKLPCDNQNGECAGSVRNCVAGSWQQCGDADYLANSGDYESGDEKSCDNKDNNCDGVTDNIALAFRESCAKTDGVCSGSKKVCDAGSWIACTDADYLKHSALYEAERETLCDANDNNCDGTTDNIAAEDSLPCAIQTGVCNGSKRTCSAGVWQECTAVNYGAHSALFEDGDETLCDGNDNNCDGTTDNIAFANRELCEKSDGVCSGARKSCSGGSWQVCTKDDYLNHNAAYEDGAEEVKCDNKDNNCDGSVDNIAPGERLPCEKQAGVCSGSLKFCVAGSWQACGNADYTAHNALYEAGSETKCDGFDNNCDDAVDNIQEADRELCTKQSGACSGAKKSCSGGSWQACDDNSYLVNNTEYESGDESKCDNIDNNCDGSVDNIPDGDRPLCVNQNGVCVDSRRSCGGAAGWLACDDARYKSYVDSTLGAGIYESVGGAETKCDGLDNNCSGTADFILDADKPLCEKQAGVCSGAKKSCGGATGWLVCDTAEYLQAPDGLYYDPDLQSGVELCDARDNNCDGTVDNGIDKQTDPDNCGSCNNICTSSLTHRLPACIAGVCGHGECEVGWSDPDGDGNCTYLCEETNGGVEKCDGVDNDCNGTVDDTWSRSGGVCTNPGGCKNDVCFAGTGVCRSAGILICNGDGSDVECDAVAGAPSEDPEATCDNLDNDCNGTVDDPWINGDGKYFQNTACGNCNTDCTAIFDKPNATGVCDVTGAPECMMECVDDIHFDMNQIPDDGCEFELDTTVVYVSESDSNAADDDTCGFGPWGTGTTTVGASDVDNYPCKSIAKGLERATSLGRSTLKVADGLYEETVTLIDGIDILGGYRADTWERHLSSTLSTIRGNSLALHTTTIVADAIASETVIEGFVIYGQVNYQAGGNSYIIHMKNSPGVVLRNNTLYAGTGGPGANAAAAAPGTAGADGAGRSGAATDAAYDAYETSANPCSGGVIRQYNNGGSLTCGADNVSGGNGGGNQCPPTSGSEFSGIDGVSGQAGDGASGGSNGSGGDAGDDGEMSSGICRLPGSSMTGSDGTNGSAGVAGAAGIGCADTTGTVVGDHWIGNSGLSGVDGGNGGGGGGGGAGGGGESSMTTENDRLGGHGGGGGSGGCGGVGGDGGGSGGGAFAVFILGGSSPTIENNTIFLGLGGEGGSGGNGGVGGSGGHGGDGGICPGSCWCYKSAGKGGEGGDGGHGAGGGGGCGGNSFGIFTSGLSDVPDYCGAGDGNSLSSGSGGAEGNGGNSFGNSGQNGIAGGVIECINN